jgi:hypothetical protein
VRTNVRVKREKKMKIKLDVPKLMIESMDPIRI